jgi:hypothetical protein
MYHLANCCTNEVQEIRLKYSDGRTADLGLKEALNKRTIARVKTFHSFDPKTGLFTPPSMNLLSAL